MSKPQKPAPLPPGTVVGGYQVIRKLAAGGFGVVYLAEDAERRLVALKEYLPSSLAERAPGELIPRVKPDKQPLYRLGLPRPESVALRRRYRLLATSAPTTMAAPAISAP